MKLGRLMLAAAVAAATPAAAQYVSETETVIKAVGERDGAKLTEIVDSRGASVLNARGANGNTALMVAVAARDDAFTRYLLQEGADPNYATGDGDRPLIEAARIGYGNAVEWLLVSGAKADATNRMGETALIVAVQQRRGPIVEILLRAGADPDLADSAAGYSARDYARRDSRSRRMLELIEAADAKPKPVQDINDFKLK
jgi:ankyrin repeat protein